MVEIESLTLKLVLWASIDPASPKLACQDSLDGMLGGGVENT